MILVNHSIKIDCSMLDVLYFSRGRNCKVSRMQLSNPRHLLAYLSGIAHAGALPDVFHDLVSLSELRVNSNRLSGKQFTSRSRDTLNGLKSIR